MKKVFILIILLLMTGCESQMLTKLNYKNISSKEAYKMIYLEDNIYSLIDVRTNEEYKSGHLLNSINIPYDQIADKYKNDNKEQIVIVYCQSGKRAEVAAKTLIDMGYTNVYTFGGINNWNYSDAVVTD